MPAGLGAFLLLFGAATAAPTSQPVVYPDTAPRPAGFHASQQDAFAFAPVPERSAPLALEVHPDSVQRPFFHAWQQQAASEVSPQPERSSPLAVSVFPDAVARPFFPAPEQLAALSVQPKAEEKAPLDWAPSYPDRAFRTWLPSSGHPYFALAPAPERTSALAVSVEPDRVDRPSLHASSQLAVSEETPKVERSAPIAVEVHPDFAVRASFHASQQLASSEVEPEPEERVDLDWAPAYPDRATRAVQQAAPQPSFALAPRPERTSLLSATSHPDRVERPALLAHEQPFVTGEEPQPEDRQDLDWSPSFPEQAKRGQLPTAAHLAYAASQQPERTSALASEVHADAVGRPSLAAANQLAATELYPFPITGQTLGVDAFYPPSASRAQGSVELRVASALPPRPERTSPLAAVAYPDRIDRASLHASAQQACSEVSPQPEDRQDLDWAPNCPERTVRAALPTAAHPHFATSAQPERTSSLAVASYPDRTDRAAFHASQQLAVSGEEPRPEERIDLDWSPSFPEKATRASEHASQQPFAALAPQPERTSALASEVHADAVARPSLHASRQLAVSGEEPQPEERTDLDWSPTYPDRASRAAYSFSGESQFLALAPQPERTQDIAATVHPDRVDRPALHASAQLAALAFYPVPIPNTIQLGWSATYPDRVGVVRPTVIAAAQLAAESFYPLPLPVAALTLGRDPIFPAEARGVFVRAASQSFFALAPQPERKSPLASESHPDRVERATFHASLQLAVSGEEPKPEERIDLDWCPAFPESARRASLPVSSHPFVAFAPAPERTSALAVAVYPDGVVRPSLLAHEQQAASEVSPEPEERADLDWSPRYPDSVRRAWLLVADQSFLALAPRPERTQSLASEVHPDRTERATFATSEQLAATELSPFPIPQQTLGLDAVYPSSTSRARLPAADQAFFALAPAPERTRPLASESHPDAVSRALVHASTQLAVTEVSPRPEERQALDWQGAYPERALRAWLSVGEQSFLAFAPAPERSAPLASESHEYKVVRPFLGAYEQQALAAPSPRPERTSPLASEWHADAVARAPALHVAQQLAATEFSPEPVPPTIFFGLDPIYPDRVLRDLTPPSRYAGYFEFPGAGRDFGPFAPGWARLRDFPLYELDLSDSATGEVEVTDRALCAAEVSDRPAAFARLSDALVATTKLKDQE